MEKIIKDIQPLLQNDYGKDYDCSLTSITTIFNYYLKNSKTPQEIYNKVEKIALKFFYNGDKMGTIPIFISQIGVQSWRLLSQKRISPYSKYLRELCFNFSTIKNLIDKNIPIILNISKHNNGPYNNHSVVIVGYEDSKQILYIYDNWYKKVTPVNYKDISKISSINYFII